MTTHPLLSTRWSPSIFDHDHQLSRDELELLLTAARWAPSAGNTQPWSFIVTQRGDDDHAVLVDALSRGNSGWVPRASAVLVGMADVGGPMGEYAEYALGQAVAHLSVQARAMDLHTHQFSGFDQARLTEQFEVPDGVRVVAAVAIGRHGNPAHASEALREREARPRTRKDLGEVAFTQVWGKPW